MYAAEILHGGDGELFNLVVAAIVGRAHAPGGVAQCGAVVAVGIFDAVEDGLFEGIRRGDVAVDLRVNARIAGFDGGDGCRDGGIAAAGFDEALPNGVMAVIGGGYGFGFAVEAGGLGGTGGDEGEGQQGVAVHGRLRVNLGEFWRDCLLLSSRPGAAKRRYSHPPKASYGVAPLRRTTTYCLQRRALPETFGG